jgi:hypothetical protein
MSGRRSAVRDPVLACRASGAFCSPATDFGGGLRDAACHLKANRLFRWDRTIEPTFLAVEIILEVVDTD